MKKRLISIGGLGALAGLLVAAAWYVADACTAIAFRVDTDKNLVSNFIENKILKD